MKFAVSAFMTGDMKLFEKRFDGFRRIRMMYGYLYYLFIYIILTFLNL